MKADIGHIDNRGRISKEIDKVSIGKTGHCRIRKVQFILFFFFPVESTEKGLHVFHDPNQNLPEILIRINFEDGNACFVSEETGGKKLKTSDQTLLSTLLAV